MYWFPATGIMTCVSYRYVRMVIILKIDASDSNFDLSWRSLTSFGMTPHLVLWGGGKQGRFEPGFSRAKIYYRNAPASLPKLPPDNECHPERSEGSPNLKKEYRHE
jgi:hypothetical protein